MESWCGGLCVWFLHSARYVEGSTMTHASTPLYCQVTFCPQTRHAHLPSHQAFRLFLFWHMASNTARTVTHKYLCGPEFQFQKWGWKLSDYFPNGCNIPEVICEGSNCSTPSPTLVVVCLFNHSHSWGCEIVFHFWLMVQIIFCVLTNTCTFWRKVFKPFADF